MSPGFPSREFNDAVAAICHGQASDEQSRLLNELLRTNLTARDEYLLRVELHSRLASAPDLFTSVAGDLTADTPARVLATPHDQNIIPLPKHNRRPARKVAWALAAGFALLATLGLVRWLTRTESPGATSRAIAVLSQTVDARWSGSANSRPAGAALEPGWLHLKSGLVQVTFYSGARLMVEGPATVQLVSANEAVCRSGRVLAEVPPQARGFRLGTPQVQVVDLGTQFGLNVNDTGVAVHVFKGEVEYEGKAAAKHSLTQGQAVWVAEDGGTRATAADPAAFAALFDLQRQWLAMLAARYDEWRAAGRRWNRDSSLLARFDFEDLAAPDRVLHNVAAGGNRVPDATIVGCQVTEGRWPGKRALDFRNLSDRVRFNVPGEFRALTLTAWVNVTGLDRQFNSLFMCDGFEPGTFHWLIRNDGVLGLTVFGPQAGDLRITATPPVLALDKLGMWLHLAVVVDGKAGRVIHYVNGVPVSRHAVKAGATFRIGPAELGNWDVRSGPNPGPNLIRNLSGALDEFGLFSRALSDAEIRDIYLKGKPDA